MLTYRSLHKEKRDQWRCVSRQTGIWQRVWRGIAAIKGRVANVPWRPLLSKKLLRLNSVFLEARYCINLCKGIEVNEEAFNFEMRLLTTVHLQTMSALKTLWTQRLICWFVFLKRTKAPRYSPDLVAVDHQMVRGGEWLEDNHPAGVGGPLKQCVSQLWDVHIHFVCAVDQIWEEREAEKKEAGGELTQLTNGSTAQKRFSPCGFHMSISGRTCRLDNNQNRWWNGRVKGG